MFVRLASTLLPTACLLALPAGFLTACFHPARRPVAPAAPVSVETRIGAVRAIGNEQRFVLVETPSALSASALPEGQLLHCRSPDAVTRTSTADLRVSRERHESLVVANVVAGQPAVDDLVYSAPSGSVPTPTPLPGPVSAVPTAPLPGLFGPYLP